MKSFLLFCALLSLFAPLPGRAQGEFTTWCFGNDLSFNTTPTIGHTAIKIAFGPTGPLPATPWRGIQTPSFEGGNATISDAQGNLRLSSPGFTVVDNTPTIMLPLPFGLNGAINTNNDFWWSDADLQPVVIAPAPGNDHDEYVFFWEKAQADGRLAFALGWVRVDMRLNGGHGAVAGRGQLPTLTRNPRLTIVRHRNNRDFWVLTRDLDTRGFQAFRLSAAGVAPAAVLSLAGQAQYPADGELKAAPSGIRLACGALRRTGNTGEALLCTYDFDNATGEVRNEMVVRRLPVTGLTAYPDGRPTGYSLAGTCSFSPDSRLLYAVEPNANASATFRRFNELWQYDLSQPTPAAIAASRFWVSNVPTPSNHPLDALNCWGLQLAPDGTLWAGQFYQRYHIQNPATGQWSTMAAAIVRHPNVAGAGCGFEAEGYFYQPGQVPGVALPNVITNMLYAPAALNYEAACPEDSVQFWASSAGDPAGLHWDFGEPASGAANQATGRLAAHRYQQGGTYAVRLTLADGRVLTQAVAVAGAVADFTHQNVFTPNADGLNDEFRPVRQPLPGGRLRVYSRWGSLVFSSAEPAALRWDGAGSAAGEYLYQLDYPDCHGATRQQRGPLLLVR
ncbi:hypothetical protein GCM10028822_25090 [Hymenobacter terrigena]